MNRTIDISNYEEWFIDHLDGILTEEEAGQLQSFLIQHPDLAGELEGLDVIDLQAHEVSFPNKEDLLMPTEKELLLMSIAEEGSLTKLQGLSDSDLKEMKAWKNAILQPDESIVFHNKASLLKEESTPIIPLWLVRVAIAASVVGVISWAFFRTTDNIYEPREGLVNSPSYNVEELLRADYSEFNYESSEESEPELEPFEPLKEEAPMMAEQQEQKPQNTEAPLIIEELEIPEESIAQSPEVNEEELPEESEFIIEEPMPLLSENDTPVNGEQDLESLPEEEILSASLTSGPSSKGPGVKVYNSVFDFLKGTVKETVEESELFAMEEVKKEDDYVKTSLRIGSFEFSRGRRKK